MANEVKFNKSVTVQIFLIYEKFSKSLSLRGDFVSCQFAPENTFGQLLLKYAHLLSLRGATRRSNPVLRGSLKKCMESGLLRFARNDKECKNPYEGTYLKKQNLFAMTVPE